MFQQKFELLEPCTIQEAIKLLTEYGTEAKIIAGGTDLLVQMRQKKTSPRYLVSLLNISELNYIKLNSDLRIGSMTTVREIEKSQIIRKNFTFYRMRLMHLLQYKLGTLQQSEEIFAMLLLQLIRPLLL